MLLASLLVMKKKNELAFNRQATKENSLKPRNILSQAVDKKTGKVIDTLYAAPEETAEERNERNMRLTMASESFNLAMRSLTELTKLAGANDGEGDYAASALLRLLENGVGNLQFLVEWDAIERGLYKRGLADELKMPREGEPSRFEHLARDMEAWPVMWHSHPEKRKEVEKMMRGMNLGAESGLNFAESGKAFSYHTDVNRVVLKLYKEIESRRGKDNSRWFCSIMNGVVFTEQQRSELTRWACDVASKLSKLSREKAVLKSWVHAAETLLPIYYGKEFHTHPELVWLLSQDEKKLLRWEQRRKIKKKLADAWFGIARIAR
jgi:proteasome lid subunit RPN8/RPN11